MYLILLKIFKCKKICKNNIPLIEDNAIYFGNYNYIKEKVFSGSYGAFPS